MKKKWRKNEEKKREILDVSKIRFWTGRLTDSYYPSLSLLKNTPSFFFDFLIFQFFLRFKKIQESFEKKNF